MKLTKLRDMINLALDSGLTEVEQFKEILDILGKKK